MIIITSQPEQLSNPDFRDFTIYDDGKDEVRVMDAEEVYCYARDIIRGRWPEAEGVIKKSSWWTYLYTCNIIRGRWLEAEDS